MKKAGFVAVFLLFFIVLNAKTNNFEFTKMHQDAYELIISLRFEEGKKLIKQIKLEQPDDVLVYHIENYIDFLSIFINENKAEFKSKEKNKDFRLAQLKKGDSKSPYYLFSQAELLLQWALTRIKFEEYLTAAIEVNKAIGLLEKNQKLFPDFISNKKSLSILHAIAGTIPDKYKGIIGVISNFDGTIDQGLREIEEVLAYANENDYLFKKESIAIKSTIMLHLKNEKEKAWTYLNNSEIDRVNNPLAAFLLASTAMKCGRNDEAILILEERKRSIKFFPMYYLDLMLGSAKLHRLDKDANIYIRTYLKYFKGQNYIKDAYRKIAWYELVVNSNKEGYKESMRACHLLGNTAIDEDKSAMKEAARLAAPNKELLKARLLYDGGYYDKAITILNTISQKNLSTEDEIEFLYRKGRVFQAQGKSEMALNSFEKCKAYEGQSNLYYICNSTLQMGIIYESQNQLDLAENNFQDCLTMKPSEYKNSLHQKAKAGLNRLKE